MSTERRFPWLLLVALTVTGLAFARALSGELVYDDLEMIGRNAELRSLKNIPAFFARGYWDFLGTESTAYNGYWRPLTATALALGYAIGGGSVAGFHALSLAVHLLATAAVWAFARRLTRSDEVAFFTALLFGVHPLHVEGVAWITALNDPLFALFGVLALTSFLRWREAGSRGVPLLAAMWFALSLLSKELGVTVLPILIALDLLRDREQGEPRLAAPARAYAPLVLAFLGYYLARVWVFGTVTAGAERITTLLSFDAARMAVLRVELLGGALGLLAWPVDLDVFRQIHPGASLGDAAVLGALAALLAWSALGFLAWRGGRRAELLALLIAPLGVLPILGRVSSLGRFPLSDRFLYLPVLGIALYASALLIRLLPRSVARGVLGGAAILLALGTWQRVGVWQNEETLFRSAVTSDARNAYARWGLGRVLLTEYQQGGDRIDLDEAFLQFDAAARLLGEAQADPDGTDVFACGVDMLMSNLGLAYCLIFEATFDEFHDYDTPIAILEQSKDRIYAIRSEAQAAREQGLQVYEEPLEVERVHDALGVAHRLAGQSAEAEKAFRAALTENEAFPEAHRNLGRLLMDLGDADRARHHFQRALELRPGDRGDRLALAQALIQGGWPTRAADLARELHAEDESDPEPMIVLIGSAHTRSDWSEALRWSDRIMAVAPNHGHGWHLRAQTLLRMGETQTAVEAFRRAADLTPKNFEVRFNFASVLIDQGALAAAVPHTIEAYALAREPKLYLQLRETLRALPLATEDLVSLSVIDRNRMQGDMALAWTGFALERDPRNGQALLSRGRLLLDRGDAPEAANNLRAAVAALPGSFVALFELGAVLAKLGRNGEALENLRAARELGPPLTWDAERRTGVARRLKELIDELEAAGPLVGPAQAEPTGADG